LISGGKEDYGTISREVLIALGSSSINDGIIGEDSHRRGAYAVTPIAKEEHPREYAADE